MRKTIIRTGLETLFFTGAHKALRGIYGGVGAILTLHHVRPARNASFQPNRLLEIEPAFLEDVIVRLRRSGVAFISLDEMHQRLLNHAFERRFVCFTLDDGYRDNLEHALPIFQKYSVPFAIYVATSFAERAGDLWWLTLEAAIAARDEIACAIAGREWRFETRTAEQKRRAYEALYRTLRALPREEDLRGAIGELGIRCGVDPAAWCRQLCMDWDELAQLATDPLATIGAHTVNHFMLRKHPEAIVRAEMRRSADAIEKALGRRPSHFSYPVGDPSSAGPREFAMAREEGFKTGVTTRPGVLFPEHRDFLTALPRISLNGEFQRLRYVEVLTSGAATAVWNRFRRVNAA